MNRVGFVSAAIFLLLFISSPRVFAEDEIRIERVQFAKGATSAVIKGRLKGYSGVDYLVRGGAGQTINVSLKRLNLSNYFNVLPPGSKDVAMYAGQTGEDFKGVLPTDGDYTIRVYLMRAAAVTRLSGVRWDACGGRRHFDTGPCGASENYHLRGSLNMPAAGRRAGGMSGLMVRPCCPPSAHTPAGLLPGAPRRGLHSGARSERG
jgi:hypothetical protein